MINRQKTNVNVYKKTEEKDEYGYKSDDLKYIKTIDMALMLYTQNNTDDIRYKEATHIALTSDKTLDESMWIVCKEKKYKILLVNNFGRLAHLILKELI